MTSDSEQPEGRRFPSSKETTQVNSRLWADVMALLQEHADEHQLTPSGAVHDCLRRYFKLPLVPLRPGPPGQALSELPEL